MCLEDGFPSKKKSRKSKKAEVVSKNGDLRVWWIPQIPMESFYVPVATVEEAQKIMSVLAAYDVFQFEHHIKPDYSNVGGVQILEDGVWVDTDDSP